MATSGFRELEQKLASLGAKIGARVMRGAMRKAIRPTVTWAKVNAPEGEIPHRTYKGRLVAPGFAKRSIRSIVTKEKAGGKFRAVVGVRKEAFYALQFVELGTARQPKQPWLVPAFENTKDTGLDILKLELAKGIEKEARKK